MDLLALLLRERPPVVVAEDLTAFWRGTSAVRARFASPIERGIAAGFVADRAGFAFAAGYEAALHALIPSLPPEAIVSFAVTEEGGNHPRAIRTHLERDGEGFVLTGSKRFSTLSPLAQVLVVIASEGTDARGRPRLRAIRVEKGAPRLTVTEMGPIPFVPEVPHGELRFDGVRIAPGSLLPGDGYADYTKPFRTVEDVHVNAALLGYFLSAATRFGFPAQHRERFAALAVSASAVARLDPRAAETHLVLAGFLSQTQAAVVDADASWALAEDAERDRWYRDRALVHVAHQARDRRRERAWQALNGESSS